MLVIAAFAGIERTTFCHSK